MIPNMSGVLVGFEQKITKRVVTTTTVDFVQTEVNADTTIKAVVQVADMETKQAENLDFSKRYIQIHSGKDNLDINDFVLYKTVKYRIVRKNNYSDYGYVETIGEQMKTDVNTDIRYPIIFGSTSITLSDGTRELVNSGTSATNAVLKTGQGLFFDGTSQYIELNGYVAQLIYFKDGVFTVNEINATLTGYQFGLANGGNGIAIVGAVSMLLASPSTFDSTTLDLIKNNPEKSIYRENGVLKSAFLPQATLDAMEAGNGFAYLMNENTSASDYATDISKPMPSNLVVNGGFDVNYDNWIVSNAIADVTGGYLTLTSTSSTYATAYQDIPCLPGNSYIIELDMNNIDGIDKAEVVVRAGNDAAFGTSFQQTAIGFTANRFLLPDTGTYDFIRITLLFVLI